MSTSLYVFDLDETLIHADSAMLWNEFLVKKGIVKTSRFLEEDRRLMQLYSQGKLNMVHISEHSDQSFVSAS